MAPPGSRDWNNLLRLVSMVVPAIEAELLAATQPVLLVHPGLLARYGQIGVLERLRDQVGRRGVCPGLWVLVAADEQSELPCWMDRPSRCSPLASAHACRRRGWRTRIAPRGRRREDRSRSHTRASVDMSSVVMDHHEFNATLLPSGCNPLTEVVELSSGRSQKGAHHEHQNTCHD